MEEEKISAKGAVERFLALPANIRLRDSGDEKFASIYQDVKQLCVRMLAIKYGKTINLETAIENAGQGSLILVVRELSPADLPILNDRRVIGVVREGGSSKDHVSLRMIDREKAGLVGVKGVVGQIVNGVPLIIDGREELLIVNPTDEKLDLYQRLIVEKRAISERLRALRGVHVHLLECTTSILMMGNVVTAEEVASTVAHQMDGIGLVRTEFFFINNPVDDSVRKAEPEIAEQIDYYQNIIAAANGQEVTFRTIDPDVDKSFPYFEELNGQLDPTSKKGIQLCLDRNSPYHFVFCNQIRALLQTQGRFRVMFPLVQSAADCRQVQALIEEIRRELESAGQPTNQGIVFGMMVEHPRVLSVLPEIFKHKFIRFVSIGTNDLTHFLTATSRYSTTTARYFDELDPRVIRAINTTITQAVNHGIDVSLCGAMGNDWRGLLVLLAMGLEKISFSTGFADLARKIILSVDKPTLEQMLVQIRKIKTAAEIRHYIGDFTREQIRSGQWCGLKEIEPLLFT
jgi:phosphotransferase system enzyme I (PtsI)